MLKTLVLGLRDMEYGTLPSLMPMAATVSENGSLQVRILPGSPLFLNHFGLRYQRSLEFIRQCTLTPILGASIILTMSDRSNPVRTQIHWRPPMSASFPQMAFWVIFPLAALIVLSGWVMILISAFKKLRSRKQREGNDLNTRPSGENLDLLQSDWNSAEQLVSGGSTTVPFA
jgi:hypothetical protein